MRGGRLGQLAGNFSPWELMYSNSRSLFFNSHGSAQYNPLGETATDS